MLQMYEQNAIDQFSIHENEEAQQDDEKGTATVLHKTEKKQRNRQRTEQKQKRIRQRDREFCVLKN